MEHPLSEKWIKASITGTIWAASEIVLGSFLHNLKVPFSGNILTAIGLVILISMSYKWAEKGLFWRAGLICALMKTMSPSAVIFGPMIAIIAESLILELFTRLSGRTYAGYILGAMVAMSWNLFQKIINYIIFYGASIVDVYVDLLKLAQKQLNINTDLVWLPIIVLLIVYALFGLLAAVTGIRVGRRMLRQPGQFTRAEMKETVTEVSGKSDSPFNYSIGWLILNVIIIIFSFFLLNKAHWIVWSLTITGIIIIWSFRYRRAFRQLSKPGFWIFFVIITLITAFVFTRAQSGENMLQKGLLTGFQMNFRAALIITGFSVLGTELYNPVIRNFFLKTSFKHLPLALELSVESLPAFISKMPDFRTLIKNPVSILYDVMAEADKKLSEIRFIAGKSKRVYVITGKTGEGKTTFVKNLIKVLTQKGISTFGIISEKITSHSEVTGYDVVNIKTGEKEVFLRLNEDCGQEKIGRYTICKNGLEFGRNVLKTIVPFKNSFIIIDEVGVLELKSSGWAESIDQLTGAGVDNLLLVVRETNLASVMKRWNLEDAIIFNIAKVSHSEAIDTIIEHAGIKSLVQ